MVTQHHDTVSDELRKNRRYLENTHVGQIKTEITSQVFEALGTLTFILYIGLFHKFTGLKNKFFLLYATYLFFRSGITIAVTIIHIFQSF